MGNHDRLRSPRWAAGLLLMASTASALTLSNFQVITSSGVPIACILAYNSVIPSCTLSDFQRDSTCSAACAAGLASAQEMVSAVCDGVSAPSTSVLGQALEGNLVGLLCPSADTTTSSKQTSTTTQTQSTTSSTASRSTTATTLSRSTLTSVTSSTAPSNSEPPPRPTVSFVQSQPSAPAPTQPNDAPSSIGPPEPTSDIVLGGGSPFDAVVVGSSNRLTTGALQVWPISITIGLVLLW